MESERFGVVEEILSVMWSRNEQICYSYEHVFGVVRRHGVGAVEIEILMKIGIMTDSIVFVPCHCHSYGVGSERVLEENGR